VEEAIAAKQRQNKQKYIDLNLDLKKWTFQKWDLKTSECM
jgi:hypothetical protein